MPLEEYWRKRDFARTPEPAGEAGGPAANTLRYVIQKHSASRLHYDFRLELDGVLKSWAVPKGPSLDPHEKRLAVEVEDHPIEYGEFEGVIPEGEYGSGTVMLWDRGTWTPSTEPQRKYSEGLLKFRLNGEKLRGWWTLVRMKRRKGEMRDNWLLIKERDDEVRPAGEYDVVKAEPASVATGRSTEEIARDRDSVRSPEDATAAIPAPPEPSAIRGAKAARMPARVGFEFATRVEETPPGDGWLHEVKYDGYRAMLRLSGGRARFLTRGGKDWTDRFAGLAKAAQTLPAQSAMLDGEVVVFGDDGRSSFGGLQDTLSSGGAGIAYVVFDLLYLDGFDLRGAALAQRKRALRALLDALPAGSPLRYAEHVDGSGREFHRQACTLALEGVVSKREESPYVSGRGRSWVKVRCLERQEFVVGGFTDPSGSRKGFGALLLGYRDAEGGRLRYAGRVGTGFTDRDLKNLSRELKTLEAPEPPFADPPSGAAARGVHWVSPEIVAEVTFLEWTRDGALRQPSFVGVRDDRRPEEVVRERATDAASPSAIAGVTLTNPDRLLFPAMGVTKMELALYLEAVAPRMLEHCGGRPLTLVRCPRGHERECFYQKHAEDSFPPAVLHTLLPTGEGERDFVYVEDASGLVSLAQMGVLEVHPWNARVGSIEKPDRIVFDLDPGPGVEWAGVTAGALALRRILDALGLTGFVKTTGGMGLHVVVPIERHHGWDEIRAFAREVVDALVASDPSSYTPRMAKAERAGRIFVDYLRNAREATAVGAYSLRAREGAPVSTPVTWEELGSLKDPAAFDIRTVQDRLGALKDDPWKGYSAGRSRVTAAMREALSEALGERAR